MLFPESGQNSNHGVHCLLNVSCPNYLLFLFLSRVNISVSGIPRTTFRFSGSLEGLIIFILMAYYSERIEIKISKGKKMYTAESRKNQAQAFSCLFPVEKRGWCLILSAVMCDRGKLLPTREAHLSLSVQGFSWESCSVHD